MGKLKLATVVGTRPEIIRLSEVVKRADKYFEQTLVHTGQNYDYELNQVFFEDFQLREPDYYLNAVADGMALGEAIGGIIAKSYELLASIRPDALLILGDTNSCLASIAAKRLQIPIFHMEAGNRCFDERLPEEMNRRIVDHIADVNLCYSEHARRNLLAEGRPRDRSLVVGSPMPEVLAANLGSIAASDILERLGLEKGRYIVVSAHREENVDSPENLASLIASVNALAAHYDVPVLYSCHPRSRMRISASGLQLDERVTLSKPLGFHDYVCLQLRALAVVSDSGTLPEEAAYFAQAEAAGKGLGHLAAVCIRTSTERPEALETGNFVLAGIKPDDVLQATAAALQAHAAGDLGTKVADYQNFNVSSDVVKIIQSYASIVDEVVWHKGR
jgi:UDP-N-acetylglucosamine 2-epimerase (non-hydrolysing)